MTAAFWKEHERILKGIILQSSSNTDFCNAVGEGACYSKEVLKEKRQPVYFEKGVVLGRA